MDSAPIVVKNAGFRSYVALTFLLPLLSWGLQASQVFKSTRTQVEFVSSLDAVDATTQNLYVALSFKLTPERHIYWKNSGDSGTPPSFDWDTNHTDLSFSEILWPAPKRLPLAPLMSYGYEKEVFLPVEIKINSVPSTDLKVKLKAN